MRIMKVLQSICRYVCNSDYRFLINDELGFCKFMKDESYIRCKFHALMKCELNLDEPKTFNEKLQWLKLYNRRDDFTMMVDKYRVRDYITKKIGEEYLVPLLGAWESPKDIDFETLPEKFVLKCNHNSGLGMCICKDKSKLDINRVTNELSKGLNQNYYLLGREWPYKNVSRLVIAEEYIEDSSLCELRDYKFFCFNGEVKCFKIDYDRFTSHKANYYDRNKIVLNFGELVCPPDWNRNIGISQNIDKMIELAERLSEGYKFIRVDLYDVGNRIYFGELTFFPASGFGPFTDDLWDYRLGSWINIPVENKR